MLVKRLVIVVMLLAVAAFAWVRLSAGEGIKATDLTSTIQVKAGSTFEIALEANPGTGYGWQPVYDKQSLTLEGDDFVTPTDRLGAPGLQVFRFKALQSGKQDIRFDYMKPWEGNVEKTATAHIEVR